ncbi:LytR/AlgR family response regulator transcription factor [Taibaiella soli]|uniref:DNA-binding response regulator n=1 Tax=Taibaiella soli TaxID=1649169 RepID=A0A2W2ATN8_9BACT|nr:response regulator [Taibaiella soli]PZF71314.1 DNA-binding response regulator [Taibaiella soli]
MYNVILIDDEPLARQLVKSLLQPYNQFNVVAECADGFDGFKMIQQHNPDLIFLDVQMPRVNGFEMLELLDNPPSVIFTTAFDEYALKAFEAHAIDYLLKPITRERFDKAIQKWLAQAASKQQPQLQELMQEKVYEGYQHRIVVKDNGLIRIIPANDIYYVEANDDYVKIVTKDGSFLKKSTLGHIEQSLDPQHFVRVHRSYLIPVSQLVRIEPYEKDSHIALLQCGAKVTVSKTGMTKLKSILGW